MEGLFDAARRGSRAAEAEIRRTLEVLARVICRGRGPGGAADLDYEDVAQEAARKLFATGLDRLQVVGSERSYLYAIVKSTAIQFARSVARRRTREEEWGALAPPESSSTGSLEVRWILSRLPRDCRRILTSAFLYDVPYAALARELGMAESSVRSKVSRCVAKARSIARGGGES